MKDDNDLLAILILSEILFKPKMDKDAPEILVIFFNAMIETFYVGLIEKTQYTLL
jgi:hypothetical protein